MLFYVPSKFITYTHACYEIQTIFYFESCEVYILFLVLASRCSNYITCLGVCGPFFCFLSLYHHHIEADVTTLRVLVEGFTGEHTRSIWRVTSKCLKGIKVLAVTGLAGIPFRVNILFGFVIIQLVIIIPEHHGEEIGGRADSE